MLTSWGVRGRCRRWENIRETYDEMQKRGDAQYFGDEGEVGEVGEYFGDVGEYFGDVGESWVGEATHHVSSE